MVTERRSRVPRQEEEEEEIVFPLHFLPKWEKRQRGFPLWWYPTPAPRDAPREGRKEPRSEGALPRGCSVLLGGGNWSKVGNFWKRSDAY